MPDSATDARPDAPELAALASKVRVTEDPARTARLPRHRPARLTITLADGRTHTAAADNPIGDSDHLTEVAVLDLGLDDIADADTWNAAVRAALDRLADTGATAVVNGCSAVDVDTAMRPDIAVIDPTATALRLLAAGAAR